MTQFPKISVLIACRDRFDLLKQMLQSVKAQTYPNIEIVLVDDGSREDLRPLYGLCDQVLNQSPYGISNARNEAMLMATGDLFFVADSDDILLPDCLTQLQSILAITGSDIAFSKLRIVDTDLKPTGEIFDAAVQTFSECYQLKRIPHPALYTRAIIGDTKYDESLESSIDYDFILALLLKNPKTVCLNECLYLHRDHPDRETRKPRQEACRLRVLAKYKKHL